MRDDPSEYRLMARWLTDPRVLEFYHGRDQPHPYQRVIERYGPRTRGESPVRPCILDYQGEEIGYLQFYPVTDPQEYELEDSNDSWGI